MESKTTQCKVRQSNIGEVKGEQGQEGQKKKKGKVE